jgi:hypothetical protein
MHPKIRPRCHFVIAGRFFLTTYRAHGNVPNNRRPRQRQPLQPISEALEVLLRPVLHDLGAVPDCPQMNGGSLPSGNGVVQGQEPDVHSG